MLSGNGLFLGLDILVMLVAGMLHHVILATEHSEAHRALKVLLIIVSSLNVAEQVFSPRKGSSA